ncbi:hypothetical protein FBULB1_7321 [Fusarium bulbicola]|nr:hypothetical protein FBULB1_7321 [Fusarium bulbicola]
MHLSIQCFLKDTTFGAWVWDTEVEDWDVEDVFRKASVDPSLSTANKPFVTTLRTWLRLEQHMNGEFIVLKRPAPKESSRFHIKNIRKTLRMNIHLPISRYYSSSCYPTPSWWWHVARFSAMFHLSEFATRCLS